MQASALEWQQATPENKLATCADILAVMYQDNSLTPDLRRKLTNIDKFKPYAKELVAELDSAFTPDADPEQNYKTFTNQTVAYHAVLVMTMKGWLKK